MLLIRMLLIRMLLIRMLLIWFHHWERGF
jgi:hypothetical protein